MMLEQLQSRAVKLFDALYDSGGKHLTPVAELTINGRPFGTLTMSRIISIELTDKRGFEADELTIQLNDYDGALAIPAVGDKITLALGYKETGLVDKGEYLFSEFTASGSPDTLSITARSADLAETLAEQQEKSWHKQTLYQIVEAIAKRHGYQAVIADKYRNEKIDHIDQTNESDAGFLTRLAEQYDAIATVKAGRLLFIPAGEAQTAGGKPIEPLHIVRAAGDSHSFTYSATNAYQAVRAYYTDKQTGRKKEVLVNQDNAYPKKETAPPKGKPKGKGKKPEEKARKVDTAGQKTKTLRHLYATERSALNGARAAYKKLKRGAAEFSITLAAGRPDIYPETPATVQGFKPEIDNENWLITEVAHRLDDGGYTCAVKLEAHAALDGVAENNE
ncbi:contractile injection system protein, VgrG/Pvc8 family [Neisseria wadsworthii]|uniref:contractile injection system protein, VgrG/Pvc8 family n=1 Tax=Neisseria wadsworthii TaxID=607711 RepID=UPI000D2FA7B1|nr:contractile injection system protein, VgrG/Pvc8 family [Neisseria wadsworthii]